MRLKLLLLIAILIINHNLAEAQDDCELNQPLKVTEFKGRLLFEHNRALFSVKEAQIDISKKGEGAFYGIANTEPDSNGHFEIKGLKPGKYYLSIESMVGIISLLEFEIVAKNTQSATDNLVELKQLNSLKIENYPVHPLRLNGKQSPKSALNIPGVLARARSTKLFYARMGQRPMSPKTLPQNLKVLFKVRLNTVLNNWLN
jgi:hypothetical protein